VRGKEEGKPEGTKNGETEAVMDMLPSIAIEALQM
jgi:hypothetical protein